METRNRQALEKEIPHNVEAEMALLGSCQIDPEAILRVSFVRASSFYEQRNGWIFDAILTLHEQRKPVDFVTLCDELERREQLKDAGGVAYLTHLTTIVPSALHVESYGHIVEQAAQRRRLLGFASRIAIAAYKEDEEIGGQVDALDAEWTGIVGGGGDCETITAAEAAAEVHRRAEKYYKDPVRDGDSRWLDTGWLDMNAMLGGWRPAVYMVLGVEHCGKTALVLEALKRVCDNGARAMVFTLEQQANTLIERIALADAAIERYQFERGDLTADQWETINSRIEKVAVEWDVVFDETSDRIADITARARLEHRKKPLDFVVVDCLGLLSGGRGDNRNQELGDYTRALHLLATRDLKCPVLVPHHISAKKVLDRSNKRPQAGDAYESGHIGQWSDVELAIYRDEMYNAETEHQNIMEVWCLKDRAGGSAGGKHVNFFFRKRGGAILDATTRQQSENGWRNRKDIDF